MTKANEEKDEIKLSETLANDVAKVQTRYFFEKESYLAFRAICYRLGVSAQEFFAYFLLFLQNEDEKARDVIAAIAEMKQKIKEMKVKQKFRKSSASVLYDYIEKRTPQK